MFHKPLMSKKPFKLLIKTVSRIYFTLCLIYFRLQQKCCRLWCLSVKDLLPILLDTGKFKVAVSVNQIPNLPVDSHGTKAESQALLFPSLYRKQLHWEAFNHTTSPKPTSLSRGLPTNAVSFGGKSFHVDSQRDKSITLNIYPLSFDLMWSFPSK